jgi:hypothetical protein
MWLPVVLGRRQRSGLPQRRRAVVGRPPLSFA